MSLLLLQHDLSYHLLLVNNFQVSHRFLGDARMVGSSLAIWAIWTWHSNAILHHWWTNLSPWFIGVSFPGLMVTPRGWSRLLLHIPITSSVWCWRNSVFSYEIPFFLMDNNFIVWRLTKVSSKHRAGSNHKFDGSSPQWAACSPILWTSTTISVGEIIMNDG